MQPEDLDAYLRERLGERVVDSRVAYGQLTLTVAPEALVNAARLCKEDAALGFDFWEFNSPVDLGDDGFALVTHLYSVAHRHHINLRVLVPGGRDTPKVPSLTSVYRGANWSEREAHDMFGIEFEGHPRLGPRILTVENFEGWPMRKDFHLTTRDAKPWPGSKEPEERHDDATAASPTTQEAPVSAEDKAAAAKAKAERAKAKAAEMRAKKARERAGAEQQPAGGEEGEGTARAGGAAAEPPVGADEVARAGTEQRPDTGDEQARAGAETAKPATGKEVVEAAQQQPPGGDRVEKAGAEPELSEDEDLHAAAADQTAQAEEAAAQMTEPDVARAAGQAHADERDERAAAVEETGGGETTGVAAAQAQAAAGEPEPSSPEGAAEIAGTSIAKDAAAGAVGGDTLAGAPGDVPNVDEPVHRPEAEAQVGEGAPETASGAPGIEAEGRHGGGRDQSGARPAAETLGMDSEPQEGTATRTAAETPAPGPGAVPEDAPSDQPASATRESEQPPSATMGAYTPKETQPDVPVVPAPGSGGAPLASDEPAEGPAQPAPDEDHDERAGIRPEAQDTGGDEDAKDSR